MKNNFFETLDKYFTDNNYHVSEATYLKKSRCLNLTLVVENALRLSAFNEITNYIEKYFESENLTVYINFKYENNRLKEEDLKEYLNYILKELIEEQPRFNSLADKQVRYEDNSFIFLIPNDLHGLSSLTAEIEEAFRYYGLNIGVLLEEDITLGSVEEKIQELDNKQKAILADMKNEAQTTYERQKDFNKKSKFNYAKQYTMSKIRDIPQTQNDLAQYSMNNGLADFMIEGYIFASEVKQFTNCTLATLKVTDDDDSIVVKKWLRGAEEIEKYQKLKEGDALKIQGKAEYDSFQRTIVLMASKIELLGAREVVLKEDLAPVKRVELHCHSKMSSLDGLVEVKDYLATANRYGHKAIAITDHNGVYNIPEIDHAIGAFPDLKPIFGVELNYIDDSKYFIAFNRQDIDLKNATFVVFDLETTGLSCERDTIIEIAATKCTYTGEIDSYETFVNPKRHIPEKITDITSITDDMVKDAPTVDVVLKEFLDFAKGSILVAHNAKFDVNMIYAHMDRLGYEKADYPVIDTLNAFRILHFGDVKRFNLKELCKFYKVKQEHHHRAIDDTRVTALCFLQMLQEFNQKGISNYSQINDLIDPNIFYKALIPNHINILVKNQVGLKNMYKLLSDAMTTHCYGEGRLLKSVLDQYRDGILVGSGCVNGEVFQEALIGRREKLADMMKYYDYIEVQPPLCYKHLFNDMENGYEVILETIKLVIDTAKSINKMVVATSDAHYLDKNEHKYRDILIASPLLGGLSHSLSRYDESPEMHFRTTDEMLDEFSFLGEDLAYEIVVTNTNKIADQVEMVRAFHKEMFAPRDDEFKDSLGIESIIEETKKIVKKTEEEYYGLDPHPIVKKRLDRELKSIISNGYTSVYYMSHLLVTKSLNDGYLVGSRGSVGSSLVATMMQITEINPLAPHYRCPHCKFQVFKMNEEEKNEFGIKPDEESFQSVLASVESGYDLPDAICPICGEKLIKDGHDIPFETFLGFNGDKVPDIDLNFSGDYQSVAHEFVRTFMGYENAFRGGTIQSLKDKNAFGYVKGYCERKQKDLRNCEMDRIATKLINVRRSTGQHPGGIIVVPHYVDIYDVTPVQYPADNTNNEWRTTHFDYHSFENNLLKLDILGHDDPTIIKYLMDYVHEHQEEFPFSRPQDIPIDDKNVYRLFSSTDVIGLTNEDENSPVASYAVPEFGTTFVRKLLSDTMPKTFAELVKISGLSHGTGVWAGNAQELVLGKTDFGAIPFSDVIGCRDDIMVYLLYQNLEPLKAFEIMEFVRKGKVQKNPDKWKSYKEYMIEMKVPDWYVWSCEQIQYMFPKAHATAYVLMALRIAWFKVYSPKLFYSAWFTARAKAYSVKDFVGGKLAIKARIEELESKSNKSVKEDDLLNALYVAREMVLRGINFLPLDINLSDSKTFLVEENGLRVPFSAVDGLGESVAIDIVEKRKERPFSSKQDVEKRTKLNQTLFQEFELMHAFGNLPEKEEIEEQGLFSQSLFS